MGGAQYQIKLLIESLAASGGYDVTYLTKNYAADFRAEDHRIVGIDNPWNVTRRGLFFDAPQVLSALDRIRPDVIYQRVASSYTGIGAYYAKANHCDFIWHISSDEDVTPFRLELSRDLALKYVDKKVAEYGLRNAKKIVAQTKEQAQLLDAHYGRSPSAIIGNFHPFPTEQVCKKDPIEVIWIGNLKPLKQPEVFFDLARDLQGGSDVRFTVIGALQGSKRWRESLVSQMDQIEPLSYLGALSQKEVNDKLLNAGVLVNTSLWEGFSNTFIQAWMRRVPVVSLNVDPNQLLSSGEMGMLSRNYGQLCNDVSRLLEDADLRRRLGAQAQAYAFENHSEDNIEKLIELIDG
jgi:glycosyltransferase involved in cell wall biosynthesis